MPVSNAQTAIFSGVKLALNRMQMMEHIHLAGEDEDELYSGFNDYDATLDTDVSGQKQQFLALVEELRQTNKIKCFV